MANDTDNDRREETARRAYEIWEREGRPGERDLDHWLAAEAELQEKEISARVIKGPPITNLDRALPPAERAYVRSGRQDKSRNATEPAPSEHFVVVADRVVLRIMAEDRPRGRGPILRVVHTHEFPEGHEEYFERDTSPQGRFPGNTRHGGMSIDERLPMQREQERRLVKRIGTALADFLRRRPDATWDFAAAAPLHRAILDELDPAMRSRLRRQLPKELTKHSPESLNAHFADAAPPSS